MRWAAYGLLILGFVFSNQMAMATPLEDALQIQRIAVWTAELKSKIDKLTAKTRESMDAAGLRYDETAATRPRIVRRDMRTKFAAAGERFLLMLEQATPLEDEFDAFDTYVTAIKTLAELSKPSLGALLDFSKAEELGAEITHEELQPFAAVIAYTLPLATEYYQIARTHAESIGAEVGKVQRSSEVVLKHLSEYDRAKDVVRRMHMRRTHFVVVGPGR